MVSACGILPTPLQAPQAGLELRVSDANMAEGWIANDFLEVPVFCFLSAPINALSSASLERYEYSDWSRAKLSGNHSVGPLSSPHNPQHPLEFLVLVRSEGMERKTELNYSIQD